MYVFLPGKRTNFVKVCGRENVFSPEECGKILDLFDPKKSFSAGVNKENNQNSDTRRTQVSWVHPVAENVWIFDRLYSVVTEINAEVYGFDLSGFYEALQLARYQKGDHYNWHEDNCEPEFSTRKLSLVVQLSDPNDYLGGYLEIFPGERASWGRGSISIFPSFLTHRVTPIQEGTRYSLTGWVTGPAFR